VRRRLLLNGAVERPGHHSSGGSIIDLAARQRIQRLDDERFVTKEDLYARAQELDIAGRSSMSERQVERAIEQAG
jgi:hypothetical protein